MKRSTSESDIDHSYHNRNSNWNGTIVVRTLLCLSQSVDYHEATTQQNTCNSEGKSFPQVSVAVSPTNIGPDDILWLRCSFDIRCIYFLATFEAIIIAVSEDILDLFKDGEIVEKKNKVSSNVGIKCNKDSGQLFTVLLF